MNELYAATNQTGFIGRLESDGMPVLQWFGGRVAAELRLWDAIDQRRLVPFAYYGVHDGVDLREVAWRRGRGYDLEGLSNVLTADDARASMVTARIFLTTLVVSRSDAREVSNWLHKSGSPAWSDTITFWPMTYETESGLTTDEVMNCSGIDR